MKHKNAVTKAVILAGGLGTRLSEETYLKPKPMVEIVAFRSVAHHEVLLSPQHKRLYNLLRIQGLRHQRVSQIIHYTCQT